MKKVLLSLSIFIFIISLASCKENIGNTKTESLSLTPEESISTTEEIVISSEVTKDEWNLEFAKTTKDKFQSWYIYQGEESYNYYFGLNLPYAQKVFSKDEYYLDDYGYKIEEDKIITYIRLNEDDEYTISSIEKTDPYELLYSSLPNRDFWKISTDFDDYVFEDGKYISNQNGKEIEVIFTERNMYNTQSKLWNIIIKKDDEIGKIFCTDTPSEGLYVYNAPKDFKEYDTEMKEYSESFQSIMSLFKEHHPNTDSIYINYSTDFTIPYCSLYEYYDNYILSLLGSLDYKEVELLPIGWGEKIFEIFFIDSNHFIETMSIVHFPFYIYDNQVSLWFVIDGKYYQYVAECDDEFVNQIVEICDEYYLDTYLPYTRFRKELLAQDVFYSHGYFGF